MAQTFAVILTYNRKDLLEQCLSAVFAQSRLPERVIVIDNGSTDGTEALLRERWGRAETYVMSTNIGAAGGYSAGLRIAYREGADFLWLMDDDVVPAPDALENLFKADDFLEDKGIKRAFVVSSAWTENGQVTNCPKVDTRPNPMGYENWPLLLEYGLLPVTRSTFVSILIPRSTITEYGLPIAQMYIWGDDSEFTIRATKTCPGYMVARSKVLHLRQIQGMVSIDTETNPVRLRYHRYLIRNQIFVARRHLSKLDLFRLAVRHVQTLMRLLRRGNLRKACIVWRGLIAGLWFRPKVESADAPIASLGATVKRVMPPETGQLSH